jgi:hypothetical protein
MGNDEEYLAQKKKRAINLSIWSTKRYKKKKVGSRSIQVIFKL